MRSEKNKHCWGSWSVLINGGDSQQCDAVLSSLRNLISRTSINWRDLISREKKDPRIQVSEHVKLKLDTEQFRRIIASLWCWRGPIKSHYLYGIVSALAKVSSLTRLSCHSLVVTRPRETDVCRRERYNVGRSWSSTLKCMFRELRRAQRFSHKVSESLSRFLDYFRVFSLGQHRVITILLFLLTSLCVWIWEFNLKNIYFRDLSHSLLPNFISHFAENASLSWCRLNF